MIFQSKPEYDHEKHPQYSMLIDDVYEFVLMDLEDLLDLIYDEFLEEPKTNERLWLTIRHLFDTMSTEALHWGDKELSKYIFDLKTQCLAEVQRLGVDLDGIINSSLE